MIGDKELLDEKLKGGFSISVSQILSDSFSLFGKGAGSYISLMLVLVMLTISLGFALSISFEFMIIFGIVLAVLVMPVVQVGVARFAKNQLESKPTQFADFLSGTKYNYSQLILQAAVILVINAAVTVLPDLSYYSDYYSMIQWVLEDPESMIEIMTEFNEAHADRGFLSFLVSIFS